MQDLSFDFVTPHFKLGEMEFSVMIYTFCNAYAPDAEVVMIRKKDNGFVASVNGLCTAGGQIKVSGQVEISGQICEKGIRIKANARMGNVSEHIRCIKVTLYHMQEGKLVNLIDSRPREIPQQGLNLKYPEGWRDVGTPLVILRDEKGKLHYFCSLDTKVRDKRFVFLRTEKDISVELIFEEAAVRMTNEIEMPVWEIGSGNSISEIYEPYQKHVEKSYCLQPWESRKDVPDWARKFHW